jgi:hypothetical protein
MFFYVFQNDEKQIYVFLLFIMLKIDAFIIAMFITRSDFFSFELKILNSLRLSLKSLIVLRSSVLLIDFVDFLSFRKRLIADWSIDWSKQIFFRERILMTIFSFEFLIESSNFEWSDWFKKDFFSKEIFFFVRRWRRFRFYSFEMSVKSWKEFNDVRLFMIIDFVFVHSWFFEY